MTLDTGNKRAKEKGRDRFGGGGKLGTRESAGKRVGRLPKGKLWRYFNNSRVVATLVGLPRLKRRDKEEGGEIGPRVKNRKKKKKGKSSRTGLN